MLTIEEIKKAVEVFKPEGFGIKNNYLFAEAGHYIYSGSILGEALFDCFLDRCIIGMATEDIALFIFSDNQLGVQVLKAGCRETFIEHNGTTEGIRQARIKAIIFVLDIS